MQNCSNLLRAVTAKCGPGQGSLLLSLLGALAIQIRLTAGVRDRRQTPEPQRGQLPELPFISEPVAFLPGRDDVQAFVLQNAC